MKSIKTQFSTHNSKFINQLNTISDFELIRESIDLECKLAAGRDGKGALPKDFWPTYSAFANTNGGIVLLGVREKKDQFHVEGIVNPSKVRKELFDGMNNRQKVSCSLLTDAMVSELVLELLEPYNQTRLKLRMIDLFPEEVMSGLQKRFGRAFDQLGYSERVVLALAASEGTVNHARLKSVTSEHPVDLSKILQHLTTLNMLESTGGRGAIYYIKGEFIPKPEEVFGSSSESSVDSYPNKESSYPNLSGSYPNKSAGLPNLNENSRRLEEQRNKDGCLVSEHLSLPVIDDFTLLSDELLNHLEVLATEPRNKKRLNPERLIKVILDICQGRYVTIRSLAKLVNRHPKTLQDQYLKKLVRERRLQMAFPTTPTHERQAYAATPVPPLAQEMPQGKQ